MAIKKIIRRLPISEENLKKVFGMSVEGVLLWAITKLPQYELEEV